MCREPCRFQGRERWLGPHALDPAEMDTHFRGRWRGTGAKGQRVRGQCCRFWSGRLQGRGDIWADPGMRKF